MEAQETKGLLEQRRKGLGGGGREEGKKRKNRVTRQRLETDLEAQETVPAGLRTLPVWSVPPASRTLPCTQ